MNQLNSVREKIQKALQLDHGYLEKKLTEKMQNQAHRIPAAVLFLFGWNTETDELCFLITQRTETVESHKSQMAFPGGVAESSDKDIFATALRETEEETGIPANEVEVLGVLPSLITVSTAFWVTPVIGVLKRPVHEVSLQISAVEIAEALWLPWKRLEDQAIYCRESYKWKEILIPVHVFQVDSYRIWGMTAAILKNFLERLERV